MYKLDRDLDQWYISSKFDSDRRRIAPLRAVTVLYSQTDGRTSLSTNNPTTIKSGRVSLVSSNCLYKQTDRQAGGQSDSSIPPFNFFELGTKMIDLSHKSHNALVILPTMYHSELKCARFYYGRCIVDMGHVHRGICQTGLLKHRTFHYEFIYVDKFVHISSHILSKSHIKQIHMITSSNGNIFRVTGHLCGEFIGPRWIPRTKASDAELWCFLWSASEWTIELTIVRQVIWDAIAPIMTSL